MRGRVLGGVMLVVGLWVGVTLAIPFLASQSWVDVESSKAALLGDRFGAVGALFAGLGSLGVVVVLAYDLRHRKEEFRPFVTMETAKAKLSRASWSGGSHYTATVELDMVLESGTGAPALNLMLTAHATIGGDKVLANVDVPDAPLRNGDPRPGTVNFTVAGPTAVRMVEALLQDGVTVVLSSGYDGLNGTGWVSEVSVLLKTRQSDQSDARGTLDRTSGQAIEPSSTEQFGTGPLTLESVPVKGTWAQRRAKS